MKRCSQCHFTFDDYEEVCDFDGTELTPHPDSPPLSDRVVAPGSPFFHSTKFRVGVAGLTLIGLGWATVSTWNSRTSREVTPATQPLIAQSVDTDVKPQPASSSTRLRRVSSARRPAPRIRPAAISKRSAISKQTVASASRASKKDSKVTAVLKKSGSIFKKTVSILKRPFDF